MSRFLPAALVVVFAASSLPLAAQQQLASATGTRCESGRTAVKGECGLGTIQGNALDSTNRKMINAIVRLRDARFGQIVDTQLTDKSGIFTFQKLEPGSYIVEIMANDQSILAASELAQRGRRSKLCQPSSSCPSAFRRSPALLAARPGRLPGSSARRPLRAALRRSCRRAPVSPNQ